MSELIILEGGEFRKHHHFRSKNSSHEPSVILAVSGEQNKFALQIQSSPQGYFRVFLEYGVDVSTYKELSFYIRASPNARLLLNIITLSGNELNRVNTQNFIENNGVITGGKHSEKEWRKVVIPLSILMQGADKHDRLADICIKNTSSDPQDYLLDRLVFTATETATYTPESSQVQPNLVEGSLNLFASLSGDLFDVVFKFLTAKDITSMRLVSKSLYETLFSSEAFLEIACIGMNQSKKEYMNLTQRIPNKTLREYFEISKFERNLIKNPFGSHATADWQVVKNGGDGWNVENWGAPEGRNCCFVTSYGWSSKKQKIDLVKEGVDVERIDAEQPPIEVYDHISTRGDCGGSYKMKVTLYDADGAVLGKHKISKEMPAGTPYNRISYIFRDYGKVRFIEFCHKGKDTQFWGQWYGTRMCDCGVRFRMQPF